MSRRRGKKDKDRFYKRAYRLWGDRCHWCNRYLGDPSNTTLDHVTPISRGGNYAPWNIVPCCVDCNHDKGNKTLEEWES